MRYLLINSVCGIGSTGRICTDLAKELESEGNEVRIAYGRGRAHPQFQRYALRIGNDFDVILHGLKSRLFDSSGFCSERTTARFIKWADNYNPDVVWLHNLHGYYINVKLLFDWIKSRPEMKNIWTLHDCWAFTGHCAYFTLAGCNKWEKQCSHCPLKKTYPASYGLDQSYLNYIRKRQSFTGVQNLELITPSKWLAGLVAKSFLGEYPIKVVHNRIDRNIFKPTPSDFREKYHIEDKILILGVANYWTRRKGLDDFIKLSTMLDDRYVIVLVGLDRKQMKAIPSKIIGIERTDSPEQLAMIYTASDVFVNPSKEETFGMTNLEAASCGTNAIVYTDTACEEVVREFEGIAVKPGVENIYKAITGKNYDAALYGGGID